MLIIEGQWINKPWQCHQNEHHLACPMAFLMLPHGVCYLKSPFPTVQKTLHRPCLLVIHLLPQSTCQILTNRTFFKTYPNLQTPRNLAALACAFETDTSCCWSSNTSWWTHIHRGKGTNVRIRSKEIGIRDHVTTEYILNLLKRNSGQRFFRQLYAVVGNQSGCFRVPETPLNHIGIIFGGVTTVWGRYSQRSLARRVSQVQSHLEKDKKVHLTKPFTMALNLSSEKTDAAVWLLDSSPSGCFPQKVHGSQVKRWWFRWGQP